MKLHLNTASGFNAITGHGPGFVAVNGGNINNAIIVLSDQLINPWHTASTAASILGVDDFAALFAAKPELVVFGSGSVFRFPDRTITAAFLQARIGFEVMDTPAACRTYNVLVSEGRRVAAALLIA